MQVGAEKSKKAGMKQAKDVGKDVDKSKFAALYAVHAALDMLFLIWC